MKCVLSCVVVLSLLGAPAMAQSKIDQAIAKADEQLTKGKPEEAIKTMSKVVEQNPTSGEAYIGLARLQEKLGNHDEASAALAKARDLTSGAAKADVLAAIVGMELSRGTGKEALANATKALELGATPATLAALARAQARNQDAPTALITAEKAVAAGATSAVAHEARGEALSALGRDEDAVAAFRKALELDPKLVIARSRLAIALVARDHAAEAVTEARKATETDPKNGEAFAALGRALLAANPKDWNAAIAEAQQGAFLNPKSPYVQLSVGKIFEAGGNYDQAAAAYANALQTDSGFAAARLALLQADIARGKASTAIADLKKLAAEMPGSGEAQLLVGEQMLRKSEWAESVGVLENASRLSPGSSTAWWLLGQAYNFNNRLDDAANAFKKAVELAPTNTTYRTTLGLLLGRIGQHEAGVAELKRVAATPGYKDAAAWVNMGWIYRNMKPPKTTESIAAYKKALEVDPKEEQSALGLGWAYSYTKSWDDAIKAFEKAIQIEPKTAGEANNGIAWCYIFKKDPANAEAYMAKAIAGGRNDARLKDNIERIKKMLEKGTVSDDELKQLEAEREKEREKYAKYEEAEKAVRSKNPLQRARGCRDLAAMIGGDSVSTITWMMQNDNDYGVRESCAVALGSLGAAAKSALPNLKAMLNHSCEMPVTGVTAAQMEMGMKCEDFKRAVRDAYQKVSK